uniref:hypothetical protein n=1 Tax=Citrobacter freundii TaxID=546 RepID=UPI0020983A62|nr:hypothetical protein [Citrobacter freundii]URZ94146.1 hypothetical protein [Citrobacter freundii]
MTKQHNEPGKTSRLNDLIAQCQADGMRVIVVDIKEKAACSDFWTEAAQPDAEQLDGKAAVSVHLIRGRSDDSQIRQMSPEAQARLATAERENTRFAYSLNNEHDERA